MPTTKFGFGAGTDESRWSGFRSGFSVGYSKVCAVAAQVLSAFEGAQVD